MAGARGSKNSRRSKYKVKFDFTTVRTWILPILRRIQAGDYPTKIGRLVGLSRQHVHYYLKKLEECKLIHREKRSSVVFYELTGGGTNFLRSCEGVVFPGELYRLDKCQVGFGIRVEGIVPSDGFRRVEMQNWTALLGLEQGVKVRHTSRSWIVHVEVIRGKSPAEVYGLALNVANRVAVALCRKYGCVLSEGRFMAGELAVEDPVAKLFGRYFTVSTPRREIDHSWKVGELENLQKDAVIEYLQMPERVKKMEGQVERLHADLEELTGALKRFLGLEGAAQPSADQSRLDRCVA
ncbi:MAG: winged helix-turn-helix domain-containing protein [Candidatus Bathyarchaeia archaeon]